MMKVGEEIMKEEGKNNKEGHIDLPKKEKRILAERH